MDSNGFRSFLEKRKVDQAKIEASLKILQDFEDFLRIKGKNIESASRTDFYEYSKRLINTGQNTYDSYVSILRYGFFRQYKELIIAGMEVVTFK